MKKNLNPQKTVYNFISLTKMKFKSPTKGTDSSIKQSGVLSKLKSFSWLNTKSKQSQTEKKSNPQSNVPTQINPSPIQFIKKLTNQHFLVGNQLKVDIMYVGGIVEDFIDTEFICSLDFKKQPVSNIAVDQKKGFLAFLINKDVQIYEYNLKRTKQTPTLMTTIKTTGQVRFIQFAKDNNLSLFYENNIQIYYIDETTKQSRKKYTKPYNQPQGATIFQVPQAFQGVINIFFSQPKPDTGLFQLWNLQLKLQKDQILMGSLLKIYDISNALRSKIVLSNYSKEIFCMNLGHEILAVKKGYIIDTVNSNISDDNTVLRYLGNDRLIHVLAHKIQLYRFSINMALNPPRIILESTDSIYSKMHDEAYSFVEILEMLNENFVVFYQISEDKNNSLSGQIKYSFCVTQKVKFEEKIRDVLPSAEDLNNFKNNPQKKITDEDYELIEEKVDMAMKMGLTRKQIYLRLWNNSTKCDIADYQFLLDTMDYDTIRAEIQTKLKKKSMVLRQVIKIEQGCLSMLNKNAFNSEATPQGLKNFLISHFLLRKLKLYQMFHLIQKADGKMRKSRVVSSQGQKQQSQTIMINIKDYLSYAKCDLKALLLQLIRDFKLNQKQIVLKIRTLIKIFRFAFRPIYANLLEDIIKEAGIQLLGLLESIPEILPYEHTFTEQPSDATLYQGIWGDILPEQWELNLYAGGISTIDNKDIVDEIKNSVWAKRFFLTLHDLLPYSKTQILDIHTRNKAQQTFYNFIEKVFKYIKNQEILAELIKFIQNNYAKLPKHLVGQIFLYKTLYDYLKAQNALQPRIQNGQLNEFLRLKDFQICKMIFDLQKRKKNCILKDVKQGIYNSGKFASGNDIFNLALLNFFSSELSQISDIKYLLNRLNNQKYEFHSENQGMYQVIVKGMQAKLYLGSDHDIPIDEVYIYISNIHIEEDSQIKKDLKYLDIVNKYSEKFRKVKLGMSVFQIIRQVQKVLSIVVNYDVNQRKLVEKTDQTQILRQSLSILEQVEKLKSDIFFETNLNENLVLFIFLTKILESQHFIQKAKFLLTVPEICEKYIINELFIENSVIFMYKKKFSEDKIYKKNASYIKELLTLLPQQNQTKQFISYELQLGLELSCQGNYLEYPLGGSNGILSTIELQSAINHMPGKAILAINFQRIFEISLKMQQISSDGQISSITLYQIYEIVILRLLQCKMIKDSIPIIKKIIQLNPMNIYNFIYPVLLIKKFSNELCDQNRAILLMILTYQFDHPDELLDIVQNLLNTKATSLEQKIILKSQLKKIQGQRKIFDKGNPIFDSDYVQAMTSEKQEKVFSQILRKAIVKIMETKDEFGKNPEYSIIYTILLNNPYAITKYLYCSRYESNFKGIRCFLSYLNKQEFFAKSILLELGKRVFKILHEGLSQTVYIENIIDKYRQIPLSENLDVKKIKPDTNLSIVMSKCVQRFKNKIKDDQNPKKRKVVEQTPEQRKNRIRIKLSTESPTTEEGSHQYPFQDSDNEFASHETKLKKIMTSDSTQVDFDSIFQKQLMITRNSKVLGLYLSQDNSTKQKQLFYSKKQELLEIKNSVVKLKNKKKQLQEEYNMRLSQRIPPKNLQKLYSTIQSPSVSVKAPQLRKVMSEDLTESLTLKADLSQVKTQNKTEKQNIVIQQIPEEVCEIVIPAVESKINPDIIIQKILTSSQGENYNVSPILQTAFNEDQFKQLISNLYHSEKLSVNQSLAIFKKLSDNPTICQINKQFLEVFIKMDNFQKKFNLDIDMKQMFIIEGIFLTGKNLSELFNFLRQKIIELLTQSNVYKITKVISLVFKNNQIQQELNIAFLIKMIKEFEGLHNTQVKDLTMQKQKIRAFTEKISIHQLNVKDQDILNTVTNPELKNELINTIAETMRKKKNEDMAKKFLVKWNL